MCHFVLECFVCYETFRFELNICQDCIIYYSSFTIFAECFLANIFISRCPSLNGVSALDFVLTKLTHYNILVVLELFAENHSAK